MSDIQYAHRMGICMTDSADGFVRVSHNDISSQNRRPVLFPDIYILSYPLLRLNVSTELMSCIVYHRNILITATSLSALPLIVIHALKWQDKLLGRSERSFIRKRPDCELNDITMRSLSKRSSFAHSPTRRFLPLPVM